MKTDTDWQWEIRPEENWFRLNLTGLWHYKDLLIRLVRRDIIASYQQTILGPAWVFLQPLFTTLVYFVIFNKIANISTDHIPPILFYLPGTLIWTYFSDSFIGVMYTFTQNAYIFNKVYFPRLIVPLSMLLFHSFRLSIQLLLFFGVYLFFLLTNSHIHPSVSILLFPLLIGIVAGFSMGCGLIVCVFTARYRDLDNIMQFLLRLFMFAAPIVYPASIVPEKFRYLIWLNPLTPVIESFRAAFFTGGPIPVHYLLVSFISTGLILLTGLFLFKKHEIKIMDVV